MGLETDELEVAHVYATTKLLKEALKLVKPNASQARVASLSANADAIAQAYKTIFKAISTKAESTPTRKAPSKK